MAHGHRSLPWQLVVNLVSVVQEAHQCVLRWLFRRWQDTMVLTAERSNSFRLSFLLLCAHEMNNVESMVSACSHLVLEESVDQLELSTPEVR